VRKGKREKKADPFQNRKGRAPSITELRVWIVVSVYPEFSAAREKSPGFSWPPAERVKRQRTRMKTKSPPFAKPAKGRPPAGQNCRIQTCASLAPILLPLPKNIQRIRGGDDLFDRAL
jgi:hypothetical protein